jgi:hypothetical protein
MISSEDEFALERELLSNMSEEEEESQVSESDSEEELVNHHAD